MKQLYYKVGQALSQNREGQLWVITKWGKGCYYVGQVVYYKVGQSLLQITIAFLQSGPGIARWNHLQTKLQAKVQEQIKTWWN